MKKYVLNRKGKPRARQIIEQLWLSIDPVTHYSQSPYNAFDNNPVFWADPSGADGIVYGMAGQSASSNPNPRGMNGFGQANYGNNFPVSGISGASGWGDGAMGSTFYTTTDPAKIRAILDHYGKQNGYQLQQNIRKVVYPTPSGLTTYDTTIDINIWYSWAPYTTTAEDIHSALDVLGSIDPTPLSDGLNGFGYLLEGDVVNAGISAAGLLIPYAGDAAKLGRVAKGGMNLISQFSGGTIDNAVGLIMKNSNDLKHIFADKHNLGSLVDELGGQENTIRSVLNAANGKLPGSGVFNNIPVIVGGQTIFLRGNVINGVPRIGTMFIK